MPTEKSSPAFTLSNPVGLYDPSIHAYSHVAQVASNARIVHLAGQVGMTSDGNLAPSFTEQARQAIANIETALASAGATLNDIYKLTILIVDYSPTRFDEWNAQANRAWPSNKPAATLIPVPCLALEGLLIEIEAIAALP